MPKPRKRLTVGLLMLLVAALAVVFWGIDYSRRIRVVVDNKSPRPINNVTVTVGNSTRHLGPVGPSSQVMSRIVAAPSEVVRIAWDVPGASGQKDRHVMAPGLIPSAPGATIEVSWTGK
ncbi:hypothetical protein P12x_004713 [Tundrisphaera lichenicola]|uniref:hypothetical protein n=1 Tax=Tundrisphaera lichenicola TaxID=2029860 RepID=UPI003EBADF74